MTRTLLPALLLIATVPTLAEEGFANSGDDIPIYYEVRGSGSPTLIFVHGWSCDSSYWRDQVDRFAERHQVVTVDLAGHGKSGLGRDDWTMASFGGDVAAVAEDLGLDETILIGHSMGGDVIVEAARQMPGRVTGLVWVDTYGTLDEPGTDEELDQFIAPFREDFAGTTRQLVRCMFPPGADADLVERVVADMSSAPPGVAIGALQNAVSFDRVMPGLLGELKLPVVAINPDNGRTDEAALNRHGVEVVLMPDVGHFLMMEDPEGFNKLLAATIEGLAR